MKKYKYYIFDCDGTLFDTFGSLLLAYQRGLGKFGRTCTAEDARFYMSISVEELADYLGIDTPEDIKLFAEGLNEGMNEGDANGIVEPYEETFEVIDALRARGASTSIVSGNIDSHMKRVLEVLGATDKFEFYMGLEHYKRNKPFPDPLLVAFERLGVKDLSEVCYVGDSPNDVKCAAAAGVDGIFIDREDRYPGVGKIRISNLRELLS